MTRGTWPLLFTVLIAATGASAEDRLRSHPLRKSSDDFFRNYQKGPDSYETGPDKDAPEAVKSPTARLMERIDATEIGVRPLFTLLPAEATKPKQDAVRNPLGPRKTLDSGEPTSDIAPPTFALVARATGGTLVSFTRPASEADPRERMLYQRTIVSDLFQDRRVSLSIYEDHALDGSALRFLGIGGRVTPRPTVKIFGWRVRLDVFGSFHPEHGATGYAAVTGLPEFGPQSPMAPLSSAPFIDTVLTRGVKSTLRMVIPTQPRQ
jgi:hypothetical protein